jgi:hypothetical protein
MVMITGSVYILGQYVLLDDTLDPTDMIGNYSKTLNKSTEVTLAVNNIKAGLTKETESGAIGWLDTLDIIIQSNNVGGSTVYLTLAGTGLCTVTNPCSLTMNILCCFFPFASMIQTDRLKILKNVCDKKLKITNVVDLCNF